MANAPIPNLDPCLRFFWEGDWKEPWQGDARRRIYDTELVFVQAGECYLQLDDAKHILHAGMIALIPPGVWHESHTTSGHTATRTCIHFDWTREHADRWAPLESLAHQPFDEDKMHAPPPQIALHLPCVLTAAECGPLAPILAQAVAAIREDSVLGEYMLWPVLRFIVNRLCGTAHAVDALGKTAKAVSHLKHFIASHYAEPIGYPEFCRTTRLSRAHLCTAFKRFMGDTPTSYLNTVRLEHAVRLLTSTTMNVAEVARAVGIADANYFTRLFHKRLGLTPTGMRDNE